MARHPLPCRARAARVGWHTMTGSQADGPHDIDIAAMRRRLLAERAALHGVSTASAESRDPVALDQTSVGRLSRMDAMQQQAMALATEWRRAVVLARIDAALVRIEAGGADLRSTYHVSDAASARPMPPRPSAARPHCNCRRRSASLEQRD